MGPMMVLGYFLFRFKSWDGFNLFFPFEAESLDARSAAASVIKIGVSRSAFVRYNVNVKITA